MKSYFLPFLLVLSLIMQSCFVVDTLLEEDKPKLTLPFDVVVKDSVYQYVQKMKGPSDRYLSYGYEPLKVVVPEAIMELEKWEERKGQTGFSDAVVDEQIAKYDSIIMARNLTRKITIVHTFSLRNPADSLGSVQKANFILSNNLQVLDLMPSYLAQLSKDEERLFAKFYYETPILKAFSYEESQKLSKDFYGFFKEELNKRQGAAKSGLFINHILTVLKEVDAVNLFDVQKVSQYLIGNHLRTKRTDLTNYTPINFSPLYEINEEDELTGYYFFHTFSYENEEETERLSVYVKFNPFYEVERVIETDQKYDVYAE